MFGSLDEKTQRFLVGGIFFCVFLLILAFFRQHGPSKPVSLRTQSNTPKPEPIADACDTAVLGSCQVEITADIANCSNESAASLEVAERLSDPMSSEECGEAQLKLGERCPRGCIIDYGTVVLVPGKVQTDVFPGEGGGESCRIRAKRSVNMQGRCTAGEDPEGASEN